MLKKVIFSLIAILFISDSFSQSIEEKKNRIVYNRIEYFFNTRQTDSIYAMSAPAFKESIPYETLELALKYFYALGKISDATSATFSQGVAGYNILIGKNKASLNLKINDAFQYELLQLLDEPIVREKKEHIKSNVKKSNALDELVDSIAMSYIGQKNAQALAIGIIHKGKTNHFYYGETIKGDSLSIPKENTLFEIGSITKVFTATLLADLVEKKTITLDDSITKFLPDSVAKNKFLQGITFKQLANHTSGLPKLPDNIDKVSHYTLANPYTHYGRKELFSYLKNVRLDELPGEKFEYSNLGFALLGELISRISKKTYNELITEVITGPLGMINTLERVNPKTQQLSKVYNKEGNEVPIWQWQAFAGSGALKSTITDLLRFAQFQFKMPETTLENAMTLTKQFTYYLPPSTDIGLAWHMNMANDVIQYWHNGQTGGSSSFIGLVPDSKSAIVVLSNSSISVDEISFRILNTIINSN